MSLNLHIDVHLAGASELYTMSTPNEIVLISAST
jgi:hypothetical protein